MIGEKRAPGRLPALFWAPLPWKMDSPSEKRSLEKAASGKVISRIQCKEYGITRLILSRFEEFTASLKDVFPDDWEEPFSEKQASGMSKRSGTSCLNPG